MRGVSTGHSFFKSYWLLLEDQLELSILLYKVIFFNGAVAAIHSFRGYMEQIIFDSSNLLKPTAFLEDLSYAFHLFKNRLFIYYHSNCSHPSLDVVYLFLCFMAVIHSLKCTVSLSFFVPLAVICCHSLSFVVTRCHSFSLVVILSYSLYHSLSLVAIRCTTCCHSLYHSLSFNVTLCHSLSIVVPLAVTRCTTRLTFYKRSLFEIILQEQEFS